MSYYSNVNPELLQRIPVDATHVLEVGCGAGSLARAWLGRNPEARYVGVELSPEAAREAQATLAAVVCGDIEGADVLAKVDAAGGSRPFDTLVFGDVLEHLRDPWAVLAALRSRVAPAGVCVACIPNVAHWSLLQQQLRGRWDYADAGLLDRTHLRFFTLDSAVAMLEQAGWTVVDATPRILWPDQTAAALQAFAALVEPLGLDPAKLRRDLSAFQWVLRAVNGPAPAKVHVAAVALKDSAGVKQARVDYPLGALASRPGTNVVWGAGALSIPEGFGPGVLVLQRQFMTDPTLCAQLDTLVSRGWALVSDMDDDPHHWREFIDSDFAAYRSVHAVTVSTEPLAEMIRQWNPNVQVFPNAIFELPPTPPTVPKQPGRVRVFFGALNREGDWEPLRAGIAAAAERLGDAVEWVVVHDRAFHDALPGSAQRQFHPTLPHTAYMQALAASDVALLPLADTPFNRLKSDLKFIESCAAGAVPICSPVVYADQALHQEIGVFAQTAEDWQSALLSLVQDPERLARRRAAGLAYVQRERMHCHQAAAREAWYRWLMANRDELESQRRERLGRHG